MKTISILGLVLVIGIGAYVYLLSDQVSNVGKVCSIFLKEAPVGNLKQIAMNYSLDLRGPITVKNKPDTQMAIFCAPLTLCDSSCNIEFQNGQVVKAEAWGL